MSYTVAVRALCEFTARQGDLDLRFTPAPTGMEGIAGHALVAARRGAGYQREVPLCGQHGSLTVRGRADGYDPARRRLEEVKTYRGSLERIPANHRHLHMAQLKVYGWLQCQALGLAEIELALVYFDIGSQRETAFADTHRAADLARHFEAQCDRFLAWAESETVHRQARDEALSRLRFPHGEFRPGQRRLAEAVWSCAGAGRCLMAQAPTGIGKTVGTLFPLLRAAPAQSLDKLFYLAAKTSGRRLALDALVQLRERGGAAPLRVLELVARDKACEHPDKACNGESCPLAKGFYDRLPAARNAAAGVGMLDQANLRGIALAHDICPYYLSQDMARWSDVVVGDYNYFFDLGGMLHGLTVQNEWRVAALVDEAHNLLERGRKMYSAELDQGAFRRMRREAPAAVKRPLERIGRAWNALAAAQGEEYRVQPEPPGAFLEVLQRAVADLTDFFGDQPEAANADLQQFYFDALHFLRIAELFDANSLFDITIASPQGHAGRPALRQATLCLRNVVPAPFLRPRFAATRATVLFSATLSPWHFYADTLGLPSDTAWIEVESPFRAEQLAVHVVDRVSTRFRDREASLAPIAALMGEQYARRPGNYLAFFSSFDYLRRVADEFAARHPGIATWEQSRNMDEPSREAFLARFVPGGAGIGFAVLGGAFAEGVDLPGDRLVGAFIATLGLPQWNPVNEQLRARLDAIFGAGYDYAYLFPGLQKVVQAAGRVIRTEHDRGCIYLIDDRYARPEVRRLLPSWWHID